MAGTLRVKAKLKECVKPFVLDKPEYYSRRKRAEAKYINSLMSYYGAPEFLKAEVGHLEKYGRNKTYTINGKEEYRDLFHANQVFAVMRRAHHSALRCWCTPPVGLSFKLIFWMEE